MKIKLKKDAVVSSMTAGKVYEVVSVAKRGRSEDDIYFTVFDDRWY